MVFFLIRLIYHIQSDQKNNMTLPLILKPKKTYKLSRFGRNNDGGYLVSNQSVLQAKILISFGILDDISFESDFLKINQIPILCYDHTLKKSYWKKRLFNDFGAAIYNLNWNFLSNTIKRYFESKNFFKLDNITLFNKTISTGNVEEIFNKNNFAKPLFFKIDIEGSEYRILNELIEIQESICGLIIEFHDIDLHLEKIINFVQKCNLTLTHVHPNNYGDKDKNGNPTVIELTFERNPIEISNNINLPNLYDHPNNPAANDITLKFK